MRLIGTVLEDGLARPFRVLPVAPPPLLADGLSTQSRDAITARKSFAEGEIPDDTRSVAELGLRAQHEIARISCDERRVTPAYWLLGKALNAARKHFAKKGSWERWLRERDIGEDRAQKARRLATFFATPDDLAGLSLRQALRMVKAERADPITATLLRNLDRRMRGAVAAARMAGQITARRDERLALKRTIEAALDALGTIHRQITEGEAP